MAETQTQNITQSQKAHIAMLPAPGMGHLIPLVEFAERLVLQHDFSVTVILPTDGSILNSSQQNFLNTIPKNYNINYILLPPINLNDDVSIDVKIETRISLIISRSLNSLREVIKSIVETKKLVAFVVDLFGTDAFDVANEFNISPYIFYPTSATVLSLAFYFPELDKTVSCEYKDLAEPIQVPGCIPISVKDLSDTLQERKTEAYKWVLHHMKRYKMAKGIILNSFNDLEPNAIKALQNKEDPDNIKPTIYPIGPLIQIDTTTKVDESHCLKWLDKQPRGSVVYISFGSGGTLSHEQLIELASGLEISKQRFLWVIKCPSDSFSIATYFNNIQSSTNPLDFLPNGFLERTKGLGLVVPDWAPQVQILGHVSTGGFLTHCGWNSTLEGVVHGVPLIAWPLYAEQKISAVLLSEELKVALRPKVSDNNGIVRRLEIGEVVKRLMESEEGKRERSRMKELEDAAIKAMSENGSSTKALADLVSVWKKKERRHMTN